MKRGTLTTSNRSNISSSSTANGDILSGAMGECHTGQCEEKAGSPSGLAGPQPKKNRRSPDEEETPSYDLMDYLEVEMSIDDSSHGEDSDTEFQSETDSDGGSATSMLATMATAPTGSNNSCTIWTPEPPQNMTSIPFLGAPGLKEKPKFPTARDYFSMVFTEKIYDIILQGTQNNAEALLSINSSPRGRVTNWKPLSIEELNIWLGLLFHMGTIRIDRTADYWRTSKFFNIPIFRESMARDRFLMILHALNFSKNPMGNNPAPKDQLYKIRPLLDSFREAMETAVSPERELSIDESMLLWKGRVICQEYQQDTRRKHGIKMHMLCESSGLVHQVLIHISKDKEIGEHGDAVVKKLLANFKNRGHSIFMNSYYNSVALSRTLLSEKTYCTGTLRQNRPENPREVFDQRLAKGEIISRWSEEGICVFRWKNKQDIAMISSEFGSNLVATNRPGREKPEAVVSYNKFKGGVNHCDKLISYYSCEHKTLKWYKKLGIHLFQVMLVNSYILFNKYSGKSKNFHEFRLELVESLLSRSSEESVRTLPAKAASSHFPTFTEVKFRGKKLQKRCRVCHMKGIRKSVVFICPDCEGEPGLCLRPCFQEYHSNL